MQVTEMTDYRIYDLELWEKVVIFAVCTLVTLALGILFYNTPAAVLFSFVLFIPASRLYADHMASKQRAGLRMGFRDLLDSLSASFAGGRHMREALEEALKELESIYSKDEEIVIEIRGMLKKISDGETDISVLEDFADRADLEDVTLFTQVYRACRETGGNIISAMSEASDMVGDKIKIENEIRAITSQKKTEGMIISIMPVIIILFLRMIAPDYVEVLYGNLMGIVLMTGALAATGYAFWLIRRITDIEV